MSKTVIVPVLISFALSLLMGPVIIPFLRKLKMGQTEREDGVKSHLKKAGTPTMGGVIILASIAITFSVLILKIYPKIIPILFLTLGFGLIGFLDDYLKVVMRRSDGLFPMQKMALQIVVTGIFAYYIVKVAHIPLTMLIPFSGGNVLGYRMACDSASVCGGDRYGQWNQFYRRTGRSGFQCYIAGGSLFLGGGDRNQKRDRTDYLCGDRSIDGIPLI